MSSEYFDFIVKKIAIHLDLQVKLSNVSERLVEPVKIHSRKLTHPYLMSTHSVKKIYNDDGGIDLKLKETVFCEKGNVLEIEMEETFSIPSNYYYGYLCASIFTLRHGNLRSGIINAGYTGCPI